MADRKTPWLMTDARMAEALWRALDRLPEGAGVVLRHDVEALAERVAARCKARGLILSIKGDAALARNVGAAMVHKPHGDPLGLPFSLPVHDEAEAVAAREAGAALVFVSPVHATRSHPDAKPLGPERAAALARLAGIPAIALGGLDETRFAALDQSVFQGWAGIGAWIRT
ncbi:thiamine phosphate synthase [Sphingomicrobium nitratireducens]|uniref:thiamine phosphate synthase n=1 Tax=Sphingomicrobium nitratireducens TaxID=2964666 RepID=UPI00223F4485|nr:thiamine phosphate synthase [Sphingomicrobium nitratireducens]